MGHFWCRIAAISCVVCLFLRDGFFHYVSD